MPTKKEKPDNINSNLDTITKLVIAYEPGDIMAISDIVAALEKLEKNISDNKHGKQILTKLLALSHAEMKNSFLDFTSVLSEGIDFLSDITKADGTVQDWKSTKIQNWLSATESLISSQCNNQSKNNSSQKKEKISDSLPEIKSIPTDNPDSIDEDQLKLFISDCEGRNSRAQELILSLEDDPENQEVIKELFRIFHTTKGECGFLKLSRLGFLTHNIESLLDLLRSEKMKVNNTIIDLLLKGCDTSYALVTQLKTNDFNAYNTLPLQEFITNLSTVSNNTEISKKQTTETPAVEEENFPNKKKLEHSIKDEVDSKETASPKIEEKKEKTSENIDTFIKVKTGKVNYLVDMIGELLIALGQTHETSNNDLTQIRKIARTLQYAGMQLRTESVHMLFGTMKRIIRDTAHKVKKEIHTEFIGDDLEIDRTLIDALEEPLMHLVRNSIDHGIETAEERIAAGKTAEGNVKIAAERRGNNIVISVSDDGQGLDRKKILEKAQSKNLIREKDILNMTDTAVYNLIFISGFSTNEKVDFVSGRGVGMDIVKGAVTKAKGHIGIESCPGKGTTFSLFFPLSTAIIDGMTVRSGENIFIIPIAAIIESLKLHKDQVHKVATGINVMDLRENMFPILSLSEIFNIQTSQPEEIVTIVENVNKERFAIASNEIISKREVVIKNLGPCFKNMKGISSGTVLSGGSIGFVLDIEQVIELGKENLSIQEVLYG